MKTILTILIMIMCASVVCAQVPQDVPRDHWAYDAVQKLIDKGYMIGYPNGEFMGNRNLTRYEFAVVIKRIIEGIEADNVTSPVTQTNENQTPKKEVTAEDLAAISKLIDEFKPELVVIGTRLDKIEEQIAELGEKVDTIDAIVNDEEGPLQTTRADVAKLKKINVSGYVQTRYNTFQSNPDKPQELPDTFSVRRARLKVVGRPTDNSAVTIQFDGGQGAKADAGPSVTTKDAFVEHYFSGDPTTGLPASLSSQPIVAMAMGQMKWPFGYEVVQSSSVRESPERSLIVQRFFPGERDRGFMTGFPLTKNILWRIGVFNGLESKYKEINDNKDLVSTIRGEIGNLTFGVSGYLGKGIMGLDSGKNPVLYFDNQDPKTRYGADVEYYFNNLTLKAEYMAGKGVDGQDNTKTFVPSALYDTITGGWTQAAYNLNPSNTLVAKWETISEDPLYPQYGRRSTWNLGLIHYLDEKSRLKLFYQINKEEENAFSNNGTVFEWITTF